MGQFGVDRGTSRRFARPSESMEAAPDFQSLVDEHYAPLFRFAKSLCKREGLAEDMVQQTFLQWARKGHSLRDKSKSKSWLFTTLYREWLSIARRETKFENVEFEPDLHGGADDSAFDTARVDSDILETALEELDPGFREPLLLFYGRELSYKEIAEVLDVPIGTVMSRLSRAKAALRKVLHRLVDPAELES